MMSKTVILNGSSREAGSYCACLAGAIGCALRTRNVDARVIHLAGDHLPMMDSDDQTQHEQPAVSQFLDQVHSADSLVLVTPSYHNSFSGRLKNALDYLSMSKVGGKVCGLACHAGGIKATEPLAHLRGVTKSLRLVTLITQVCTNPDDFLSVKDGRQKICLCDSVITRVNDFVDELITETSLRKLMTAVQQ